MRLRIEIDDHVSRHLDDIARTRLPRARQRMVEEGMRETLPIVIENTPVDTGRTRRAWRTALGQLDGAAGDGPGGSSAGNDTHRNEGHLSRSDGEHQTEIAAGNSVPYVRYLEYGTSKMAPFAMVRRALRRISQRISSLFTLE